MKKIDIMIDIETMSLHENAAIVSIAVVPFDDTMGRFDTNINLTSCVLAGMDIDRDTCRWWMEQSDEAKANITNGESLSIRQALEMTVGFLNEIKEKNKAELRVWSYGNAFDIEILQYAIRTVLRTTEIPWCYRDVRDARTYVLEGLRILYPNADNPYSILPDREGVKHTALFDAINSITAVKYVQKLFKNAMQR